VQLIPAGVVKQLETKIGSVRKCMCMIAGLYL
jgi:hypothetical protein